MALTINTNRSIRSGSKMSINKTSPRGSTENIQSKGFSLNETCTDKLRDADNSIDEPYINRST